MPRKSRKPVSKTPSYAFLGGSPTLMRYAQLDATQQKAAVTLVQHDNAVLRAFFGDEAPQHYLRDVAFYVRPDGTLDGRIAPLRRPGA